LSPGIAISQPDLAGEDKGAKDRLEATLGPILNLADGAFYESYRFFLACAFLADLAGAFLGEAFFGATFLPTAFLGAACLAFLYRTEGAVSIHMYIATGLGVGLAMMLTAALMGLVFLSSGTGHDESIADPLEDERQR